MPPFVPGEIPEFVPHASRDPRDEAIAELTKELIETREALSQAIARIRHITNLAEALLKTTRSYF